MKNGYGNPTTLNSIERIREAAAMGNNQSNQGCNVRQDSPCAFMAAQENLLMTLQELASGQKKLGDKMEETSRMLHNIELRLERGDSALANASRLSQEVETLKLWQARSEGLVKKVEDLETWKAKAEGSALMLKWMIGLAVSGGAAGVISIIMFITKLAGK